MVPVVLLSQIMALGISTCGYGIRKETFCTLRGTEDLKRDIWVVCKLGDIVKGRRRDSGGTPSMNALKCADTALQHCPC